MNRIDIMNPKRRKIKCISTIEEIAGLKKETNLIIGNLYTLKKIELKPYGFMVFIEEFLNEEKIFGYQDYLFEELYEISDQKISENYEKYIEDCLTAAEKEFSTISEKETTIETEKFFDFNRKS